jgi:hypothetical protein
LKTIEGAKVTWAAAQHKAITDTPTDQELFGANGLIRKKPQCPSGGVYTLNSADSHPTCSVTGHALAADF